MERVEVEDVARAWRDFYDFDQVVPELASLGLHTIRLMAEGSPVSHVQVASAAGISSEDADTMLGIWEAAGASEYDGDGNITSFGGLGIRSTAHRLEVNGREMFAECALDSLFIPAFLQQAVAVQSLSPIRGEAISLLVTPEGVENLDPSRAYISTVIPGVAPETETGTTYGHEGGMCNRNMFFEDDSEGAEFCSDQPGLVVFPVSDGFEIARQAFIGPLLGAAAKAGF